MASRQTAVGKRQKIAQSNRVMFFWIAGMSAVVGMCFVIGYFLLQQLIFHTKVANEADKTVSAINKNIKTADTLRENVRLREVDAGLNAAKTDSDARALQVVLDALPADKNDLALGASLQKKLIGEVSGVSIETLTIETEDSGSEGESTMTAVEGVSSQPFSATLTASDVNILKDVMSRLERSIRTIDIDNFSLDKSENGYRLTLKGHAYFKSGEKVELTDKVVSR